MFIYWQKRPGRHVGAYIRSYWHFKRKFGAKTKQVIYPDSYYELIWVKQGELFINGVKTPELFFSGAGKNVITLTGRGVVEIYAVRFFAWGLTPFLNPEALGRGETISADRILKAENFAKLMHAFNNSKGSLYERLDAFFINLLLESRVGEAQLKQIVEQIEKQKGAVKVQELADYCRLSSRQLERIIKKATGSTPQDLMSRVRFENVRKALLDDKRVSLSKLAHEFGYADQSHLNKEFRRFTGMTPVEFVREFNRVHSHLKPAGGWEWA